MLGRPRRLALLAAGRFTPAEARTALGGDCNAGTMTAAVELTRALAARGERAVFVATGQAGMCVADRGVAADAVACGFVAGFTEELVLDASRVADHVVVEGRGALHRPADSGVAQARAACAAAAREAGLPAGDPVRFGAEPLAEALAGFRRDHAPAA